MTRANTVKFITVVLTDAIQITKRLTVVMFNGEISLCGNYLCC